MQVLCAKSTNQLSITLPIIKEKPLQELEITYNTCNNIYVIHNFTDDELIIIMKNAEIGSWLLNEYLEFGIPMNSIIIKTIDGLIHHKYFIFSPHHTYQIADICDEAMAIFEYISNKIWIKKTYVTMEEYLEKLASIYNFDIDKQIIVEDEN
jgi:hypothetical protein